MQSDKLINYHFIFGDTAFQKLAVSISDLLLKTIHLKNFVKPFFYITKQIRYVVDLSWIFPVKIFRVGWLLTHMAFTFIKMESLVKAGLTYDAITVKDKAT